MEIYLDGVMQESGDILLVNDLVNHVVILKL